MRKYLSEIGLQRAAGLKIVRAVVRAKFANDADRMLNSLEPRFVDEFNKRIAEGKLENDHSGLVKFDDLVKLLKP
jgi:hypothetical protein